jgi:alpha-tubulin suppressor-like RCC1 family protein
MFRYQDAKSKLGFLKLTLIMLAAGAVVLFSSLPFPTSPGQAADVSAYESGQGGKTMMAAGEYHSLGLRSDGTLWSWGHNSEGQLGLGDNSNRNTPTQVSRDSDWVALAAGGYHSLGLRSDGTLWTWGSSVFGQLGLGDNDDRNSPTQVGSDSDWVTLAAGGHHSLGLRSDGTLWAWGRNSYG